MFKYRKEVKKEIMETIYHFINRNKKSGLKICFDSNKKGHMHIIFTVPNQTFLFHMYPFVHNYVDKIWSMLFI